MRRTAIGFIAIVLCVLTAVCAGTAASAEGEGSIRVHVFNDKNGDGFMTAHEDPVADITAVLLKGDEEIASVTVGADGEALFTGIPAGTYHVRATLPGGMTFSSFGTAGSPEASAFQFSIEGTQTCDEFTLDADGEIAMGLGVRKAYHVSGFCWADTETDGAYQEGEAPMAGVKITLDGQKNDLHYETVSNEDGTWYIDRVCPAFYTLTVYVPDGMMFTRQASKGKIRSIFTQDGLQKGTMTLDLNDKENKENQNVGFAQGAVVKGICYLDANYNGFYDEGEAPLPGVKIVAIREKDDKDMAVTFSGEDGTFSLPGLRGNTYKIRALLPDDGSTFTVTRKDDPMGNHFASRADRRENFWNGFELADSETREIAIGAIYPATVKGTVYMDDDFSGTRNGNEKIVTTYVVSLENKNGETVAADKTGVKGVYELIGVPPGEYRLSVQAVKGYAFTKLGEGNVILNETGGQGYSEFFRVGIGDTVAGMDIGMIRPGTVEGDVFADANDNGLRDGDESGMAGVTVRLTDADGAEAFRTVIGADGHFLFDAVMPGRYRVEYILPENTVFAKTAEGGNTVSGEGGTGISETFDFVTGGYQKAPLCGALTLGEMNGTAYQDHNGNGVQDSDEETLAGMTVKLIPSRPDAEEISAVTAEDGTFILGALRPDTYTLQVTCPEGFVMSRTDNLELPLTAGKADQQATLEIPMGRTIAGQMAGAVIPAAIRGQIWLDENNNGLFDAGEQTPAGLTVIITDEETGSVFDTPVTGGDGSFAAAGMIPGSFAVSFPLDEHTIAPKAGDNQFAENAGKLEITGIQLGENEVRDGLLLGIVRYTEISGSAWIDRGEAIEPLPGVSVTLTDGDGNAVDTVTSGEAGEYRFSRLMPGVYGLKAEAPEGCVIIEPDDGMLGGSIRSVMTRTLNRTGESDPIELQMNRNLSGLDIGCVLPGTLGDVCWLDLDGDGLQGAGEGGIPGVRIEVQRDGVTVAETVTDQYGFWRVSDLYPAAYTLKVTAPAEVKPTARRTDIPLIASVLEETDDSVSYAYGLVVESGLPNYNADLGFVLRNSGVLPAGYGEGRTQDWSK